MKAMEKNKGRRPAARGLLAAAGLMAAGLAVTSAAAFTDQYQVRLETVMGGAFDIAFLDGNGNVNQGRPWNHGPAFANVPIRGRGTEPTLAFDLVTLSPVAGEVTIHPSSNRGDVIDDDPVKIALFTIHVDGVLVADHLDYLQVRSVVVGNWTPNVPKRFEISFSLRPDGPPTSYGKALILAIRCNGRSL